jgi:hypothetical protein
MSPADFQVIGDPMALVWVSAGLVLIAIAGLLR